MNTLKNIFKIFNLLYSSKLLNKSSGGEPIPEGGFRAQPVINGNYTTQVDIPISELQKAEEIVCKNPNKEVLFFLFGTKGKIDKIILDETAISVNGGNGVDSSEQTKYEVKRLEKETGLEFIGFGHNHLVHHRDEFSQHDLDYIKRIKQGGKDNVHMLLKLKENGRVNYQAINNNAKKVKINLTNNNQQVNSFIPGQGGQTMPPNGFGTPGILDRLKGIFK